MKLLLLCYEHPAPEIAGSHRVLYSLEHLAGRYGHDITLLAFKLPARDYPDLSRCARVETVTLDRRPGPLAALKSAPGLLNVFSGRPGFIDFGYSREMDARVKARLSHGGYDVIAVDHPVMLRYALARGVPVVLLEAFAVAEIALMEYRLEKNRLMKLLRGAYYRQTRHYPRLYRRVDRLIAVSEHQRDMVLAHCPDFDITVIPHGVDTDYFRPVEPEAASPCLVVSGSMSGPRNETAVLDFYRETFPRIRAAVPEARLYVVGRDPGENIRRLAEDASVVVTGYVADLRPYLSRAWVVVAPLQEAFGVKVRVLQAMAVGRPVVATPMVRTGIDVSPGENIVIAEGPREFADRVVELLQDRELRERIGVGARRLMETGHNWEKLADRLNDVLEKASRVRYPRRR